MKLKNLAMGTAMALVMTGTAYAEPITVVSWGGSYGAAQDNALFNDASKNTGIEIVRESGASMSKCPASKMRILSTRKPASRI